VNGGFGVPAVEAVDFIPAAWGMLSYLECLLQTMLHLTIQFYGECYMKSMFSFFSQIKKDYFTPPHAHTKVK
jgi:hypothetical protein